MCLQPSFTNVTIRHTDSSGHIAQGSHDHPLWKEDLTRLVMVRGEIHLERGRGVLFPWTYASGMPVPPKKKQWVTKLTIPVENTRGFPMKMYNTLSTEEIMCDIFHNDSHSMPTILRKLANQYVNHRMSRYTCSCDSIDTCVASSLDNDDSRRVSELLSVGANTGVWAESEFALYRHFSRPYFVPQIHYDEYLQVVEIDIYWTGVRATMTPSLRKIIELISTPLEYAPTIVEVDSSPEIAYALSRMLGRESEPLEKLYLRKTSNHWLNLSQGFCRGSFNTFGGVLDMPGIDFPLLVRELVRRSPLKTLVVVESDTLSMWNGFSLWHGSRRDDDLVVVTTRSMLLRSWTSLKGFKRLICVAIPSPGSVYSEVVSNMTCKVRWALCHSNHSAFNVLGLPWNENAIIRLNRLDMERMGVLFPLKTVQKVNCNTKHDSRFVMQNIATLPFKKRKEMLSKYMLKPSLVPPYVRGEKLDTYNGTISSIASNFNMDKALLEKRTKETCAVCLEKIQDPAVTPCGHVFCSTCAKELDKRNINCALCRSKINGFMRVSDENTPGKIVMHGGACYRVQGDDSWGSKYSVLKQHADATFITQYSSVKRMLKKEFPNTTVLTRKAIDHGLRVRTSKVVMVEPEELPDFDYAWGQDLEIIRLCYLVKL